MDHLSLVVSSSERNKMSAQALATVMGPPLMLHSASVNPGSEIDHAQPIAVLKYLLQIWPQPQKTAAVSVGAGTTHGAAAGATAPNTAPQVNIPPGNVILWCFVRMLNEKYYSLIFFYFCLLSLIRLTAWQSHKIHKLNNFTH